MFWNNQKKVLSKVFQRQLQTMKSQGYYMMTWSIQRWRWWQKLRSYREISILFFVASTNITIFILKILWAVPMWNFSIRLHKFPRRLRRQRRHSTDTKNIPDRGSATRIFFFAFQSESGWQRSFWKLSSGSEFIMYCNRKLWYWSRSHSVLIHGNG